MVNIKKKKNNNNWTLKDNDLIVVNFYFVENSKQNSNKLQLIIKFIKIIFYF